MESWVKNYRNLLDVIYGRVLIVIKSCFLYSRHHRFCDHLSNRIIKSHIDVLHHFLHHLKIRWSFRTAILNDFARKKSWTRFHIFSRRDIRILETSHYSEYKVKDAKKIDCSILFPIFSSSTFFVSISCQTHLLTLMQRPWRMDRPFNTEMNKEIESALDV